MAKKKRKLTEKQKAFCDYYIETLNATEAARKAGYSSKTARQMGNENLSKPYILEYIDERLKQIESQRIADAKEVMEYLTAVMRGEIEEEVVVVESAGDFKSEAKKINKHAGVRERNKAAELLGKRYALFTDKVNLEGDIGVQIIDDIEDGADEED